MKKILIAALAVTTAACSSMVNPVEIEQPGYELSPIQLQPGFERCSTIEPDDIAKATIETNVSVSGTGIASLPADQFTPSGKPRATSTPPWNRRNVAPPAFQFETSFQSETAARRMPPVSA